MTRASYRRLGERSGWLRHARPQGFDARINSDMARPATVHLEVDVPADLARLSLPEGVDRRLHILLDKQDVGEPLTEDERAEAEGLADLADLLSFLRLRASRDGAPPTGT